MSDPLCDSDCTQRQRETNSIMETYHTRADSELVADGCPTPNLRPSSLSGPLQVVLVKVLASRAVALSSRSVGAPHARIGHHTRVVTGAKERDADHSLDSQRAPQLVTRYGLLGDESFDFQRMSTPLASVCLSGQSSSASEDLDTEEDARTGDDGLVEGTATIILDS